MLKQIDIYATKYKTLFFLEALFPTLCKKYKLHYDTPKELNQIIYRKDYTANDIDKTMIYHPVKNIEHHIKFRENFYR